MAHRRNLAGQVAHAAETALNVAAKVAPLGLAVGGGLGVGLSGDKALRRLVHRLEAAEKRASGNAAAVVNQATARIAPSVEAVSAPTTVAGTIVTKKPVIRSGPNSKTVRHCELIKTIVSNGASGAYFVNHSVPLQPGDGSMGEWLAKEAEGWESYRVNECRFIYVPSVGTSDRGNIALITDYDALDAPPGSLRTALSFANTVSGAIHSYLVCRADPVSMMQPEKRKFVRDGPLHFLNSRTNDCGRLTVSTEGVTLASLTILGQIMVEYDITFYTPHVRSVDDAINSVPRSVLHVGQDVSFNTTSAAQTLPVPFNFKLLNNLHIVNDATATGMLHVPRGVYKCRASLSASFGSGSIYSPRLVLDGPAVFGFYKDLALYPCSVVEHPNAVITNNEWSLSVDFYLRVDSDEEDANFFRVSFQPNSTSSSGVLRKLDTSAVLGPWFVSMLEIQLVSLIY